MTSICILPRKLGLGGPASFQARLIEEFRRNRIDVVFDPADPAVSAILVIGGTKSLGDLKRAKRRGVRIVQRLNGMNWVHRQKFTGIKHFLRAEVNNWILSTIRSHYADRIIYQSQFSQEWWHRVYGKVDAPGTVIYNGVNLEDFSPLGQNDMPMDHYRILMVEGHMGGGYEGGLLTAVEATKLLNQRMDRPCELMVVGDVPAKLQSQFTNCEGLILWQGVVKRGDVPQIDRSAHVLFSADVNAACPNSVIEALACGLPVVGYDTGSLPELLSDDAGVVAPYGSDVWKLGKPNLHALVDAAQTILRKRAEFSLAARKKAETCFDISEISKQYIQVLLGE